MKEYINLEDCNVNVTMPYGQFIAIINDCVRTTIKMFREEEKAEEDKIWYPTAEAAQKCNRSTSTIHRWKKSGFLPAKTIGGRDYYSEEDIKKILAS